MTLGLDSGVYRMFKKHEQLLTGHGPVASDGEISRAIRIADQLYHSSLLVEERDSVS